MVNIRTMIAGGALLAASPALYAVDGMSVEYGKSDSSNADVKLYRVSAQWNWNRKLLEMGGWHLGGYWEATLGYWDNNSSPRTHDSIVDIGFTPVLRVQPNNLNGFSAYLEAGIGVHLLSHTSVSPQRRFSTAFQFGDHVGVGVRLGDKGQYDVGYRFQHLSNASIKRPNHGINFHQVRLQYHF